MDVRNIAGTNTTTAQNAAGSAQDSDFISQFTKGEIVEGTVIKVSDKISINFNGKEVKVSKSAVQNAREGEVRKFEIMDVSQKSIVLKEVGTNSNTAATKILGTVVEKDSSIFANQLEKKQEEKDESQSQEELEDIANRITEKDYQNLAKEGLSLENYLLGRLDRAIERVKNQRIIRQEGIENQVEKQQEYEKQIKKVSIANLAHDPNARKIIKRLLDTNMPVTEANVEKIEKALEWSEAASHMSEQTYGYLIGKELPITIEHVYKGTYNGYQLANRTEEIDEEIWEELEPQVESIIEKAGMTISEEAMNKCKWLFQNELPLTADSLKKLDVLEGLEKNYDKDTILNQIVSNLSKGIEPENTVLAGEEIEFNFNQFISDISTISDSAIHKVIDENKILNLYNLTTAQQMLGSEIQSEATLTIEEVTAKRQVEEIRLKMTTEAGRKLWSKGIRIDTTELSKVVEGLRAIEEEYYENLLKEAGATRQNGQTDLLRETTQRVEGLKAAPSYVLGATFETRDTQTITTLSDTSQVMKAKLDKANASYETLSTEVRRDLGDSIEKAFQSVDRLLDDIGLEKTTANQRAVRILGYNKMDITKDTVQAIKYYDSKVNSVVNGLTPSVTVELIKRGVNPLNLTFDQLNMQISQIKEELGVTEEEKYSEYLWKLDKEETLTEEERNAYIGIYRLLYQVDKTKGAAIGAVVGANQELTLKNLLSAVRSKKLNKVHIEDETPLFDRKVEGNFGEVQSLKFQKETITGQIEGAFFRKVGKEAEDETKEYGAELVKSTLEEISPSKLNNIFYSQEGTTEQKLDSVLNMSVESIKEKLNVVKEDPIQEEYYEQKVEDIRQIAGKSKEAVQFLEDNETEPTVERIIAAKEYITKGSKLLKKVEERAESISEEEKETTSSILDGFIDALGEKETIQEQYEKLTENVQHILNKGYENTQITSMDMNELKLLGNAIQLFQVMSEKEHYEVPIRTGDTITNVNLTIVHGSKESGKFRLKTDTEGIGHIESEFTVRNGQVKGTIFCENRDGLVKLQDYQDNLIESIEQEGLEAGQLTYGIHNSGYLRALKTQGQSEEVTTNTLYRLARAVIKNICEAGQVTE